jgi:mevalonate kinase
MNHNAIYALYPQVVTVDDGTGAFDEQGNQVEIDLEAVASWVDPDTYKYQRAIAYPTIQEQLDLLYWDKVNGTNNWEAAIEAVKTEYPKP